MEPELEPLLLLHGFASHRGFWDPVIPLLAEHHDVVAIDLPGFGSAPELTVPPTPWALVDAVEATMDDLGWETAHVAGHSMGGLLALELARRGRARSVTGLTPSGPSSERGRARAVFILRGQRAIGSKLRHVVYPLLRHPVPRTMVLGLSSGKPWVGTGDWWEANVRAYLECPGFDATLDLLDPNEVAAPFGSITCPIVLAYGTRDVVIPVRAARHYRELLPSHARFVLFTGIGHTIVGEDPERSAATILDTTGAI